MNLDLVNKNEYIKFSDICQFFHKILSGNKNLALIKGHNTSTNVLKIMCNNPNLDLININA